MGDLGENSSESNVETVEEEDSESFKTSMTTLKVHNEHSLRKSKQIDVKRQSSRSTWVDQELLGGSD